MRCACCAQTHSGGSSATSLVALGTAGLAEARPVGSQARGNGADVGDIAGAEPVDVGVQPRRCSAVPWA
ncbi:protein of unknown function [Bradyrhizobium vignae]|uniref:Uncharacterized protein n=1 Tax=Bradyrhizobium vignae TaxID=1549949 RepID=A0A2U3Q286_9BRAD|nr:protein of unknown function [Bradyrhizobium vignae]